jgi:hypothetical protein
MYRQTFGFGGMAGIDFALFIQGATLMSYRSLGSLVVLSLWLVAASAWAATKDWNDGTDNWSNAAAWTPAGVPGAGDTVNVVFADDTARTVTYDYTGPAITLASLNVDLTGMGTNSTTLSMAANALSTTGSEQIGQNGRGTVEVQLVERNAEHYQRCDVGRGRRGYLDVDDFRLLAFLKLESHVKDYWQ